MKKSNKRRRKIKRWLRNWGLATVLGIVLTVCLLTVGTVAYLQREAKLTNDFTVGEVKAKVEENFDGNVKKDVSLKNEGKVDAYMRAKVLVYFEDKDGNVIGEAPVENKDYTITYDLSKNWLKTKDGNFYYKVPVKANSNTDLLIEKCEKKEYNTNKDKHLVVHIFGEAIQAEGGAVNDAWGADVQESLDKKELQLKDNQNP